MARKQMKIPMRVAGEAKAGRDFMIIHDAPTDVFPFPCHWIGKTFHIEGIYNKYVFASRYNDSLTSLHKRTNKPASKFNCSLRMLENWINQGSISLVEIIDIV